jgi:multidrug efflux pump subunit AcrB
MTLLALTLAVGNLVDDAIVEIENVERHIRMGKRPVPGGAGFHRRRWGWRC